MNMDVYLAQQRAKTKTVSARAAAALARLGGETASRPSGVLTRGLTAEELERDALSIRRVLSVWKRTGKRASDVSTLKLPSGRILSKNWNDHGESSKRELAVPRLPRHHKKGR